MVEEEDEYTYRDRAADTVVEAGQFLTAPIWVPLLLLVGVFGIFLTTIGLVWSLMLQVVGALLIVCKLDIIGKPLMEKGEQWGSFFKSIFTSI